MLRWITGLRRHKADPAADDARAALKRAQADVRSLHARRPEVDREMALNRALLQRNHFAEAFDALINQGGGAG